MRIPDSQHPCIEESISVPMADEMFSDIRANLKLSPLVAALPENIIPRQLKLEGTISFTLHAPCARCLTDVEQAIKTHFVSLMDLDAVTTEAADLDSPPEAGGFEILGEAAIDVTDELRQRVYLATPNVVYCRSDCKGLCPKCGADLNVRKCRCDRRLDRGPFDALQDLLK